MPSIVSIHLLGDRTIELANRLDCRIRRSWLIKTDGRFYSELTLLANATSTGAGGIILPLPYVNTHPDNPSFLCKKLSAKQEIRAPLRWIAEADYDTVPISKQQQEEDKDPLDRAAKIVWNTVKYQKAIERDRDGYAILNSAGDYFDPPPLKDLSHWTATITKNVSVVPPGILTWPDKLNSDTFTVDGVSVDVNAAKIMSVNVSELKIEGDEEYRTLTVALEFNKDLWRGKYLNQGFYQLDAGTKKRIQINGKDCVSPQCLNSSGALITNPTPSTASFQTYFIYEQMAYTGNIPLE